MSYILDALNKSEQERQQREHGVSLQPLTGMPHPGTGGTRWLPLAAVAIVIAAISIFAVVYFMMKAKAPSVPLSQAAPVSGAPPAAKAPVAVAPRPTAPALTQSASDASSSAASNVATSNVVMGDKPVSQVGARAGTSETVKSLYQRKGMSTEQAMAQAASAGNAATPIANPVAGDSVKTFASDDTASVKTQDAARQETPPVVHRVTANEKALDAEIAREREVVREAELAARVQAELEKMQAQDAALEAKRVQSLPKPKLAQAPAKPAEPASVADPDANVPLATQLTADVQKRIPNIDFGAHVYAGRTNNGFVILNGKKRYSGDTVAPGLVVSRITEDGVILDMSGTRFKLNSMSSWIN